MRRRAQYLVSCVLALAAQSCVTSLAMHAGSSAASGRNPGFVWGGQLSGQLQVIGTPRDKLLLGVEADARALANAGSRWDLGLQVGHSSLPERETGAMGFEWHLDLGTPIRNYALWPSHAFYAGGTAGLRFWLGPSHRSAELNSGQWLLMRIPELLLYARYRAHVDFPEEGDHVLQHDVVLGVGLRFLVLSDLLE